MRSSRAADRCNRYTLKHPPQITREIAARHWREINLVVHSLATLNEQLSDSRSLVPVLRAARKIVSAPRALLAVVEEPGLRMRQVAQMGFEDLVLDGGGAVNCMAAQAIRCRKPVLVSNPEDRSLREELRVLGEASCLAVPISRRGMPWGVIQLARGEPFEPEEGVLLWMYALVLETTLPAAGDAIRQMSGAAVSGVRPPLVDAQEFYRRLDWEIIRSGWMGNPCSLCQVGWHPAGDASLPLRRSLRLGSSLRVVRRSLHPADLITRANDGSILIMLVDRDSLDARAVARSIRRNFIQSGVLDGEALSSLCLSVATYPAQGSGREELMRKLGDPGSRLWDRVEKGNEEPRG